MAALSAYFCIAACGFAWNSAMACTHVGSCSRRHSSPLDCIRCKRSSVNHSVCHRTSSIALVYVFPILKNVVYSLSCLFVLKAPLLQQYLFLLSPCTWLSPMSPAAVHGWWEAQLSQRDRAMHRVIEYFATSLKVTEGRLKWHTWVGRIRPSVILQQQSKKFMDKIK